MSDFDLYDDILGVNDEPKEDQPTQQEIQRIQDEALETQKKFKRLMEINKELSSKCDQLETNLSCLIKTCRAEINRKNNTIAELRQKIDDIILRRTMKNGSSREIKDIIEWLKKNLREDKPPKLPIPEGTQKVRPKDGAINVTNFSLDDVYTIRIGNTSFSSVISGDVNKDNSLLTIEQRCSVLQEMNPSTANELSETSAEQLPTKQQNQIEEVPKSSEQSCKSSSNKATDTDKQTSSCSKREKECARSSSYKSSEKDKYHDKRRERNNHSRKLSNEPEKNERSSRSSSRISDREIQSDKENAKRSEKNSRSRRRSPSPYSRRRGHTDKESFSSKSTRRDKDIKSKETSTSSKPHISKTTAKLSPSSIKTKSSSSSRERAKEMTKSSTKTISPPSPTDLGTSELEALLEEKQRQLLNLSNEETNLLQLQKTGEDAQMDAGDIQNVPKKTAKIKPNLQGKDEEIAEVEDSNSSVNGLLSTPAFLENWSVDSFPQFRTPDKKSRQRTESEASSNTDFNTVQGIASILKGKLVPGSYVSPKSGMIRTPEATPGREKMDKTDQTKNQVCIARTRHRSKKVAEEIQSNNVRPVEQDGLEVHASKDLVESLGLEISSSSADESSPIKANRRKRKRPLGFSGTAGQEFVHSVHKRKIVP